MDKYHTMDTTSSSNFSSISAPNEELRTTEYQKQRPKKGLWTSFLKYQGSKDQIKTLDCIYWPKTENYNENILKLVVQATKSDSRQPSRPPQ